MQRRPYKRQSQKKHTSIKTKFLNITKHFNDNNKTLEYSTILEDKSIHTALSVDLVGFYHFQDISVVNKYTKGSSTSYLNQACRYIYIYMS